jgi:hypothetical protein
VKCPKCPDFPAQQAASNPREPPARWHGIAQDGRIAVASDTPNFAEQVFFE